METEITGMAVALGGGGVRLDSPGIFQLNVFPDFAAPAKRHHGWRREKMFLKI
jgi:hypothetical protein